MEISGSPAVSEFQFRIPASLKNTWQSGQEKYKAPLMAYFRSSMFVYIRYHRLTKLTRFLLITQKYLQVKSQTASAENVHKLQRKA